MYFEFVDALVLAHAEVQIVLRAKAATARPRRCLVNSQLIYVRNYSTVSPGQETDGLR